VRVSRIFVNAQAHAARRLVDAGVAVFAVGQDVFRDQHGRTIRPPVETRPPPALSANLLDHRFSETVGDPVATPIGA